MTQYARFFDLTTYTEADFAQVVSRLARTGVVSDIGNELAVSLGVGVANVATGEAFVEGFWYQNDAVLPLPITANASGTARVDLVVIRLDRTANTLVAAIRDGVLGGGAPVPVQIVGGIWELVLATISTTSGVTTLVSDGRTFSTPVADGQALGASRPAAGYGPTPTRFLTMDDSTKSMQWATAAPSNPNVLRNSLVTVNQQPTSSVTTNAYIVDGWRYETNGGLGGTGLVSNGTPRPASVLGFAVSYVYGLTRGNSNAIAASSLEQIRTIPEGYEWGQVHYQPMCLSWLAYTNKIGTYSAAIISGNNDAYYIIPFTVTAANTWQYFWASIPAYTIGTWGTINNKAAYVTFSGVAGSNYQTSNTLAWTAGSNKFASNTHSNALTTNGDALYITGQKLEVGYVPTRIIAPRYDEELLKAERYYKSYAASDQVPSTVDVFSQAWLTVIARFRTPMRVAPSLMSSSFTIYSSRNPSGTEAGWSAPWSTAATEDYAEHLMMKLSAGSASRWMQWSARYSAELT